METGLREQSVPLADVGGALVVCSTAGVLLGASPPATELLARMGARAGEVPGSLWSQLVAAPAGESVVWSPPDQSGRILGCTRYPIGPDRALLVMREITLKQELLAQQLQRHRDKTMQSIVYLLAHDLRAPLASIVFNLDLLRDRGRELEPTAVTECVEDSSTAAAQLRETIDALVDLVRVGPPKATDLELADVVERVVGLTRPLFRQAGHDLVIHLDPAAATVRANALGVQQILLNLLVNAAEATARPMTVELSSAPATLVTPGGMTVGGVRIRVRDHGPGLSCEVRARLFQPFFTTKAGGIGLGLALARDAALAEGGSLSVVDVAHGACFEVLLPSGKAVE